MFFSHAVRHGTTISLSRTALSRLEWRTTSLLPSRYSPQNGYLPPHTRAQTTHTRRRRENLVLPRNLNIFDAGLLPICVLGLTRIVSMCLFAGGTLWAAPYTLFDPNTSNYMIPLFAVGGAIPMVASGVMMGGYVYHINILLPTSAQRSKDSLMRFVERIPPNTRLQVKSWWFRPWPVTREMEVRDLRRLPGSRLRLTNMEQVPLWGERSASDAQKHPFWSWAAKTWMGRYFVNMDKVKDRSRAPGVWDRIWEQIPVFGEEPAEEVETKMPAEMIRTKSKTIARAPPPARPSSTAGRRPPPPPKPRP